METKTVIEPLDLANFRLACSEDALAECQLKLAQFHFQNCRNAKISAVKAIQEKYNIPDNAQIAPDGSIIE